VSEPDSKHWLVTHSDGEITLHCTKGDDPAAEGIDTGVECIEVPKPDHDRQTYDRRAKCWKDCPKKQAAHDHAMRRSLSHADVVERLLALEEQVVALQAERGQ